MNGEYRIEAPREAVWKNLNDPEILRQSITGCDEIVASAENEFTAKVTAKVGPVKAKFSGVVRLSDLNPPESYKISGEGRGGAAGFAKGGADVSLAEDGDATILTYAVSASVGGKLAQLGGRLIDSTAKKYADEFFTKFRDLTENPDSDSDSKTSEIAVDATDSGPVQPSEATPQAAPNQSASAKKLSPGLWVVILVIIAAAVLAYFGFG